MPRTQNNINTISTAISQTHISVNVSVRTTNLPTFPQNTKTFPVHPRYCPDMTLIPSSFLRAVIYMTNPNARNINPKRSVIATPIAVSARIALSASAGVISLFSVADIANVANGIYACDMYRVNYS